MKREHDPRPGNTSFLRRTFLVGPHTCPWWLGYTFDNPLRRFVHDRREILGGFVKPGMRVLDIGCGLGYFSIGMAQLVGSTGKVVSLDVQPEMVQRAGLRAAREGVADRIEFRACAPDRLGVSGPVDFALAFWVMHEVKDPARLLVEVRSILRPPGNFLIVEPVGHVSEDRVAETAVLARRAGFHVTKGPAIRLSRSILCSS